MVSSRIYRTYSKWYGVLNPTYKYSGGDLLARLKLFNPNGSHIDFCVVVLVPVLVVVVLTKYPIKTNSAYFRESGAMQVGLNLPNGECCSDNCH